MFKKFDVDNTNFITVENLKEAFTRSGNSKISEATIDEIMQKHDEDKTGKLEFLEFQQVFGQASGIEGIIIAQPAKYQHDDEEEKNDISNQLLVNPDIVEESKNAEPVNEKREATWEIVRKVLADFTEEEFKPKVYDGMD